MSQDGGDCQDGGDQQWGLGHRAGRAEVSRVGGAGLAGAAPGETVAWLVLFGDTLLEVQVLFSQCTSNEMLKIRGSMATIRLQWGNKMARA